MARRSAQPRQSDEADTNTTNQNEEVTVTDTSTPEASTPASTPASTEAPVSEQPEAPEAPASTEVTFDLTAFENEVNTALAEKDSATGEIALSFVDKVLVEYRKLSGAKAKNAAREVLTAGMKQGMKDKDIQTARAYMELGEKMSAGPVSSTREPAVPTDPTDAFVQLVGGLSLAYSLAAGAVPEGVKDDWTTKLDSLVTEQTPVAKAYKEWLEEAAPEEGEKRSAPDAPDYVVAAVKLAVGKSAKIATPRKASTSGGSVYTGERRNVGNHIESAFEGVADGTFLTVNQIRSHKSAEYGDDSPSAGAVSARLFPNSGKVTLTGVQPTTHEGKKGAIKVSAEAPAA